MAAEFLSETVKLRKFDEREHWRYLSHLSLSSKRFKATYTHKGPRKIKRTKESKLAKASQWRKNNPDKMSAIRARHRRNPKRRLLMSIRVRVSRVLKGNLKSEPTLKLLGCSTGHLKLHLQSKFNQGMNWNNYGQWQTDHIIPCSAFDLSKPEEQRKCFHFSNLQPLWKFHNFEKADKIMPSQPELLISLL